MPTIATMLHRVFHDKDGVLVVGQFPNPPLIVWLGCVVAHFIVDDETIRTWLSGGATAALCVWSVLEITSGVNYFRRFLGLVVFVGGVAIPTYTWLVHGRW